MALYVDIHVNGANIHRIAAQRVKGSPGEMCEYLVKCTDEEGKFTHPESIILHHYDDGAYALASKLMALANDVYGATGGSL